jgi:hypothetical protein
MANLYSTPVHRLSGATIAARTLGDGHALQQVNYFQVLIGALATQQKQTQVHRYDFFFNKQLELMMLLKR